MKSGYPVDCACLYEFPREGSMGPIPHFVVGINEFCTRKQTAVNAYLKTKKGERSGARVDISSYSSYRCDEIKCRHEPQKTFPGNKLNMRKRNVKAEARHPVKSSRSKGPKKKSPETQETQAKGVATMAICLQGLELGLL